MDDPVVSPTAGQLWPPGLPIHTYAKILTVGQIPVPWFAQSDENWESDDIFDWHRVAGPNPLVIAACTHIKDAVDAGFTKEELKHLVPNVHAYAQGKVFVADYKALKDIKNGSKAADGKVRARFVVQ